MWYGISAGNYPEAVVPDAPAAAAEVAQAVQATVRPAADVLPRRLEPELYK